MKNLQNDYYTEMHIKSPQSCTEMIILQTHHHNNSRIKKNEHAFQHSVSSDCGGREMRMWRSAVFGERWRPYGPGEKMIPFLGMDFDNGGGSQMSFRKIVL